MNTAMIRQQLHNYLEVANDKKVKAIYTMVEQEIEEAMLEYTADVRSELDKRDVDYKNGTAKVITAVESKKRIQRILKSGRKK